MQRTEPDAGPKLLLEEYGRASQRWLEAYAAASDTYKRAAKPQPASNNPEIRVLMEPQASRTARWLERFAREKADFGPYGGPPPNLSPREAPDIHLLLDDYDPGPRFVQQLAGLVSTNGSPASTTTGEGSITGNQPAPAVAESVEPQQRLGSPQGAKSLGATPRQRAGTTTPAAASPGPAKVEDDLDLNLTFDPGDDLSRARRRQSQASSLAIHLVLIAVLLLQPHVAPLPAFEETMSGMQTVTLVAPPAAVLAELIQRNPTQQQTTKLVEPAEPARPSIVLPSAPEPKPEVIQVPDPPKIEPERRPEPVASDPKLEIETPRQPDLAAALSPAPGLTREGENRPRLRPNELPVLNAPKTDEPKLPSDRQTATGLGQDGELQLGSLRLNARPDEVIQAATENLITTGGTQIVGDGYFAQGIGGATTPSQGNRGSTLELLSDPKGVDFRPYLIQVLAAVRRNWFAVIPESARLGMARGRVAIQFIIAQDGMVPKLVIADASGTPHLDRAAVAGISASVPFQPLPSEFSGKEIRLQLVFLYNIKR